MRALNSLPCCFGAISKPLSFQSFCLMSDGSNRNENLYRQPSTPEVFLSIYLFVLKLFFIFVSKLQCKDK